LLSELCIEKAKSKYLENDCFIYGEKPFSEIEFIALLQTISSEKLIVFDQWIQENKVLYHLLTKESFALNNFDIDSLKNHFLFADFKRFLSPYLLPLLLKNCDHKPLNELLIVSSFIKLLDKNASPILQDKIAGELRKKHQLIVQKAEKVSDEKELIQSIGFAFSNEVISILNHFDEHYYSAKVELIENGIQFFKHPKTTNRIAFWIINQLNLLQLNQEHLQKLTEIQQSIRNGEDLYFKRKALVSNKINWVKTSVIFVSLMLISLAVYYFLQGNFEAKDIETKSTFSNFSKEERIKMDSILKTMKKKEELEEKPFDSGNGYLHLTPLEIQLKNRNPFRNEKIENFIQISSKVQELMQANDVDSCVNVKIKSLNSINFFDFKPLSKQVAQKKMYFKNESTYQIIILNYEDKKDSFVFYKILKPEEDFNFLAKENSSFIFVPGKNLSEIIENKTSILSEESKYHFCFADEYFENNLFQSYKLKSISQEQVKLLFNESSATSFYFLDLFEAFEKIEN
jgi:hypothetical protein